MTSGTRTTEIAERPCPAAPTTSGRGWRMVGADGFVTLALSCAVIALSGGASLAWALLHVWRTAAKPPPAAERLADAAALIVVLGRRLDGGCIGCAYGQRLARAAALVGQYPQARLLIVGGRTGGGTVSEAEAGRRFLSQRGIAEAAVAVEESSRHTLENLQHARATLGPRAREPFVLVTSRAHLARSLAMARGFDLRPLGCPAEDRLRPGPALAAHLLHEAFLLHWYLLGGAWSRAINNRQSLARIR